MTVGIQGKKKKEKELPVLTDRDKETAGPLNHAGSS